MEDFVRREPLPSWFTNRLQDRIAPLTSLRLRKASATTIEVPAGVGDAAAVVNIEGRWRMNEAPVQRAGGGAAGVYAIFVTATENAIDNVPDPFTDHTAYGFALALVPDGDTPALVAGSVDIVARVGRLVWDGAAITSLVREVDPVLPSAIDDTFFAPGGAVTATRDASGGFVLALTTAYAPQVSLTAEATTRANADAAESAARQAADASLASAIAAAGNDRRLGAGVPIGGTIFYGGTDDLVTPEGAVFVHRDGRLIDRTVYATFFGRVGHKYNLGVDPGSNKVKIGDSRGRLLMGPDSMAGVRMVDPSTGAAYANPGAAGRLTVAAGHANVAGQSGGEERHTLTAAESGVNGNGSVAAVGDHYHPHRGFGGVPYSPGSGAAPPFAIYGPGDIDFTTHVSPAGAHGHAMNARAADAPHNVLGPYEVENVFVRIA